MTTKWMGLWAQERPAFYVGQVIKKSDIPKYTRIVLRYNKYYEKESNRPKFVYCFADSEGYKDKCIKMEYEEDDIQEKIEELRNLLAEAQGNGYSVKLPSESISIAKSYHDRAVELVEEITGEKWEFPYMTF